MSNFFWFLCRIKANIYSLNTCLTNSIKFIQLIYNKEQENTFKISDKCIKYVYNTEKCGKIRKRGKGGHTMNKIKVTVNKSVILYTTIVIICFIIAYNTIRDIQYDAWEKGYYAGYQAYQEAEKTNH